MSKKSTHLSKNIGIIQYFVSVLNSFHHQKLIMLLRVDIKRSDVFYTTGHFYTQNTNTKSTVVCSWKALFVQSLIWEKEKET